MLNKPHEVSELLNKADNESGWTPLHVAYALGHNEIRDMLIVFNAKTEIKDKESNAS